MTKRLRTAIEALYYAGVWHCDRPVDEAALWQELRDAAGLVIGASPEPASPPKKHELYPVDEVTSCTGNSYGLGD